MQGASFSPWKPLGWGLQNRRGTSEVSPRKEAEQSLALAAPKPSPASFLSKPKGNSI